MGFSAEEKQQLLAIKGIGPTVIERLEQLGFSRIIQLADEDVQNISRRMAQLVGSNCWHNSPIGKASIANLILLAKQQLSGNTTSYLSDSHNHNRNNSHEKVSHLTTSYAQIHSSV